jgi:hypothetical protein
MILWLNPVGGASGDMLLGALLDAGAPLDTVRQAIETTGLTGWRLDTEPVLRSGLAAAYVTVSVTDDTTDRTARELLALAARARPAAVADIAVAAITALATVEARLHGVAVDEVRLHEIGGHDTIVDVVGVAAALTALEVDEVFCAPLPMGTGIVESHHGTIPVPAPATLALLDGATVTGTDLPFETVTPTAAALLRAVGTRFAPIPRMRMRKTGYGAGLRDPASRPNVVVAVLGEPAEPTDGQVESMIVVETTVDDVTGEVLAHTVDALVREGAADAWLVPIVGKKGRPGYVLCALAGTDRVDAVENRMLRETGSLGARRISTMRRALPRSTSTVYFEGRPIRVKHGPHRSKAEYDDLADASHATGIPLHAVADHVARPRPTDRGTRS